MYAKPLPVADAESAPFWAGCRAHKLMIQWCAATGEYLFPPVTFCPGSMDAPEWVSACGRGTIYSWIVVRHPIPREIYTNEVPYLVALVTLDEGCRIPGQVIECAIAEIYAGMKVEVGFRDVTPEVTLPVFKPVGR